MEREDKCCSIISLIRRAILILFISLKFDIEASTEAGEEPARECGLFSVYEEQKEEAHSHAPLLKH